MNDKQIRIRSTAALRKVLAGRELGVLRAFAYRAALRTAPLTAGESKYNTLGCFRAFLTMNAGRFADTQAAAYAISESRNLAVNSIHFAASCRVSNRSQVQANSVLAADFSLKAYVQDGGAADDVWRMFDRDVRLLESGSIDIYREPLWDVDQDRFDWLNSKFSDFRRHTEHFGPHWANIAKWYDHISTIDYELGYNIPRELRNIAKKRIGWWKSEPDQIIDAIDEVFPALKIPVGDKLSTDLPNLEITRANTRTQKQYIEKLIGDRKESVESILDGLISLCNAEKLAIDSRAIPNHPDSIEIRNRQLEFFDQLILGLEKIRTHLEKDQPKQVVSQIDRFLSDLEQWYLRQPKYVQRSIELTGVGSFTAGLVSAGAPGWQAFPFVALLLTGRKVTTSKASD